MKIPEQNHSVKIISKLINELSKLPGIGPKSAQRLAYHFIKLPKSEVLELSSSLIEIKDKIIYCDICQNLSDENPCSICVQIHFSVKISVTQIHHYSYCPIPCCTVVQ